MCSRRPPQDAFLIVHCSDNNEGLTYAIDAFPAFSIGADAVTSFSRVFLRQLIFISRSKWKKKFLNRIIIDAIHDIQISLVGLFSIFLVYVSIRQALV